MHRSANADKREAIKRRSDAAFEFEEPLAQGFWESRLLLTAEKLVRTGILGYPNGDAWLKLLQHLLELDVTGILFSST